MHWRGFIVWLLILTTLHEFDAPHWLGGVAFLFGLALFWRQLAWVVIAIATFSWLTSKKP
ncbi:hypothetical protein MCP1_600006 [Candidatus Terasakiella magnetica]|nr:hypothetical protein MCP1_600006 [Candidatus Terasakiella magnetica]